LTDGGGFGDTRGKGASSDKVRSAKMTILPQRKKRVKITQQGIRATGKTSFSSWQWENS